MNRYSIPSAEQIFALLRAGLPAEDALGAAPCPQNIQGYDRSPSSPGGPCVVTEKTCGPGKVPWIVNGADAQAIAGRLKITVEPGPIDLCVDACSPSRTVADPLTGYCVVYQPLAAEGSYRRCPPHHREVEGSSLCLGPCLSGSFLLPNGTCAPCGSPNSQGYPTVMDVGLCVPSCPADMQAFNPHPYDPAGPNQREWVCAKDCPAGQYRDPLTAFCRPFCPDGHTLDPKTNACVQTSEPPQVASPPAPDHTVRNQLLTLGGVAAAVASVWWLGRPSPPRKRR
jgi:hypothetical protein